MTSKLGLMSVDLPGQKEKGRELLTNWRYYASMEAYQATGVWTIYPQPLRRVIERDIRRVGLNLEGTPFLVRNWT